MRRFIFILALSFIFSAAPFAAQAKDFRDKYEEVSLPLITEYVVRSGLLPLDQKNNLLDYLAITECDIYNVVKDSQFKQQEIQAAIEKKIATPVPGDGILYVKIPSVFYILEYNFDTQSLTLIPESQMQRANSLELIGSNIKLCNDIDSSKITLPSSYNLRLNVPISFYRIPLKKEIAETIYAKMDKAPYGKKYNMLYATMLMQIEPVPMQQENFYGIRRSILRGQLNVIDLYVDQNRTILLRSLDFDQSY